MSDEVYYENLLSKRRVRDLNAKGSLTRVRMTDRQTVESLFPFFDSIPSPVEFEAVLARTTPLVPVENLTITLTPEATGTPAPQAPDDDAQSVTPMDVEENPGSE